MYQGLIMEGKSWLRGPKGFPQHDPDPESIPQIEKLSLLFLLIR